MCGSLAYLSINPVQGKIRIREGLSKGGGVGCTPENGYLLSQQGRGGHFQIVAVENWETREACLPQKQLGGDEPRGGKPVCSLTQSPKPQRGTSTSLCHGLYRSQGCKGQGAVCVLQEPGHPTWCVSHALGGRGEDAKLVPFSNNSILLALPTVISLAST